MVAYSLEYKIEFSFDKANNVCQYIMVEENEVNRGDIQGWRQQIEQGAEHLGLLVGKIVENNIELSDGRSYALSECRIEFY